MGLGARYATLLTGGYAATAAVYILFSSDLAAAVAQDVSELQSLEKAKGIGFVVVTSLLLWLAARALFRRLEHTATELSQTRAALVANEQRIAAGVMAASVAHDANNVLTTLGMEQQVAVDPAEDAPSRAASLERMGTAIQRLVDLNRRLQDAGRQTLSHHPVDLDLGPKVRDVVRLLRSHPSVRGTTVEVSVPSEVHVRVDAVLLHQIMSNLLVNAAEAVDGHGRVEVRISPDVDGGAVLEVHDNGPGVPMERREHLFDALKTTKPTGSGLGLFSVKTCVRAAGGSVAVGDSPLGGACFTVRLPRQPPA